MPTKDSTTKERIRAAELLDSLRELVAMYDGVRDMISPGTAAKLARADAAIAKADGAK